MMHIPDSEIKLCNVTKIYSQSKASITAVKGLSLDIERGEFVSIIGPSGCGKTTLLNMIAGYISCTEGEVRVRGLKVSSPGPDRSVIFQEDSIFPWMTVRENIEYGLRLQKQKPHEREEVSRNLLKMVDLEEFADEFPKNLSGGMKKRVGVARAFAISPPILLADEPFGSLDSRTREELQLEILKLWTSQANTVCFITHDIEEAIFLSDRVVVLSSSPAQLEGIIAVPFLRPRQLELKTSPEFQDLRREILGYL